MNACTRIFLSLSIVGLLVLAGPLPTASARGGHGHGGRGHGRPKAGKRAHSRPKANRGKAKAHPHRRPANRAHARSLARRHPGHAVARRPGWNRRPGFRLGWGGRPFGGNYWVGRGVYGWRPYGVNWYTPGVSSWYYPGWVYRTRYYVDPTTYVYVTSPGFSGGCDAMVPPVPASDPQSNPSQQVVLPTRN
jgi:hypothetical protein